jgi:DSF synthase
MSIVERWTANSLNLTERDLKLMERLARAQVRKGTRGMSEGAVEEIKRVELDRAWGEERTGITDWAPL